MSNRYPFPEMSALQSLARRQGAQLYLVGGYLRDLAIGRAGKDFDFAVSCGAIRLAKAFARSIRGAFVLLDEDNGCARVARKKNGVLWTWDFADFRASTLADDLKKRDFTINTLAIDAATDDASDWSDAALILKRAVGHSRAGADLKSGIIRMASSRAFIDDPLRILRAYSLRAQLGFKVDPATLKQIKKDRVLIRNVSPERIREELFKIFDSPRASATLKAMDAVGLLTAVIPQLGIMRGVRQGGYHHLDVWKHTLAVVVELEKLLKELKGHVDLGAYLDEEIAGGHSRRAIITFACLLHDIGKPDTKKKEPDGRLSFHAHEHVGRRIARIIAKQMLLSARERHALEDIVTLHLRPGYLSNFKRPSEKMVFRFMRDAGEEAVSVLLLSIADQRATRGPLTTDYDVSHHEELARPLIDAFFAKKKEKPFARLINGHDLIGELRLSPGPAFAKILVAVDEAQHLGKISTRAEALALAAKIYKGM